MANPRPTPKPENLRPPWPPGTSGNPAGYSRGRRISDAIERLIEEMALDREFGATAIAMALGKKYMLKRKVKDPETGEEIWFEHKPDIERLLVSVLFSPKKELTPITGCNALRSGHFGHRKGATKSVFFRAAGLVSAFSERRFRKVFCRAGEAQLVSAQPTEPTSLASVGCTHPIGGKPAFSTIIHARDSVKKI